MPSNMSFLSENSKSLLFNVQFFKNKEFFQMIFYCLYVQKHSADYNIKPLNMKAIFFLLFLIGAISASTVSIGTCLKYSQDGQSCQECISNYHLSDGVCFVDILGCSQYQFGNICHQCQKNYILVNNMCCDMVCMSKIFSRFKKQVKQQVIQNNTEIISQLIPYASSQYLKDTTGRLVAISVNDYLEAKRFFLLYQFYGTRFYSKRLIVDYIIKTKKFIIIDWTEVKNSWSYEKVQWTQVQDDASILKFYPDLYPSSNEYSQIVARKAVVSQVQEYQIATQDQDSVDLVILYKNQQDVVFLKKSITPVESAPVIPEQNQQPEASIDQPSQSSSSSTITDPAVPFSPYQLQYKGQDISAQLDANEPLIACVAAVEGNQQWKKQSYTLTLVTQSGKVPEVIQFTIIGQNKVTGSIIKYDVVFNKPTSQALISTVSTQKVEVQTQQPSNTDTNTVSPTEQIKVELVESKVYVVNQGAATHTIYQAPLSPQIQMIASKLKAMQVSGAVSPSSRAETETNGNEEAGEAPFISYVPAGLTFRRLVVSQFCQDSPYRQVAYVEANTSSKVQYFTYYFEINDPANETNKTWYPLGDKNKNQTQYWNTVYERPLTQTDPSFISGYSASYSQYSTNLANFRSNLTEQEKEIFDDLQIDVSNQIDRQLGNIKRFSVNMANPWNTYRATGFKVFSSIPGITGPMVAILCPMDLATQTLFISSNGPKTGQTNAPTSVVTTTVETTLTGSQTIKTVDVDKYLTQDKILQDLLTWLYNEKQILNSYKLSKIQISQFTQNMEYNLLFDQKTSSTQSVGTKSSIAAVVIHQIQSGENQIVSFQILQPASTEIPVENDVHSNLQPTQEYVVVDTKDSQDYKITNPTTPETPSDPTGTQNSPASTSDTNKQTAPDSTSTPDSTSAPDSTSTPGSTSTPDSTTSETSPTDSSHTTPQIKEQIAKIEEKERTQQIIESIIGQLETTYKFVDPSLVQVLKQQIPEQNLIKLILVVQNKKSSPSNYSVIAIAPTNNQNDPVIEQVKQIPQSVVNNLVPEAPQSPTKITACTKTAINSEGQQICLDQSSSGQANINVETTTSSDTKPAQPTTQIVAQPSKEAILLVEEKSTEQTREVDGEVLKTYINPSSTGIDQAIQLILNQAVQKQQQLQSQYKTNEIVQSSKVAGIQVAATLIYSHYAITIKTRYQTIITIRRYYFIANVESSPALYMGFETLNSPFDLTLSQNRAFKSMKSEQISTQTAKSYQNTLDLLNKKSKIIYSLINIVVIKYRTFPSGQYKRLTFKTERIIANVHIVIKSDSTIQILNLNEVPLTQLSTHVDTSSNVETSSNPTGTTTTPTPDNTNGNTGTAHETTTTAHETTTTTAPETTTTTAPETTTTTAPETTTTTAPETTPEDLLAQQQQIPVQDVVLSQKLQFDLRQVLQYLSVQKADELTGSSLEQYAITEEKTVNGSVKSIKFDLYFVKQVSDTLIKQYLCSVVKHEGTNQIEITIFLTNDIDTSKIAQQIQQSIPTPTVDTTVPSPTVQTIPSTISEQIIQEQINLNSNFVVVDPNQINYPEAISLIDQDSYKQDFDQKIDLKNIPAAVQQTIKYLRGKYSIIYKSSILTVILSTKTTTVQRFRVYFFKELLIGDYQIYRAIVDYSSQTPEKRFNLISFQLYAAHHQLVAQPVKVVDQSLKDDSDLAFGYINLDLDSISGNQNIQTVISYINAKYRDILLNKNIAKIEELKLFDGRLNYKIIFRDATDNSQFKFIVFYQPLLKKVLVLNSVNLPHHSQYNQLSSDQQKSDTLFNSALSYLNSLHPEISGFTARSVSKSNEATYVQYQIIVQKSNKKYKSIIRIASNNVDLNEVSFSEIVELSLDHYRLDQFDEMFIMNYQKLSEQEIRSNSQVRIILNFLHNSQQITDSLLLGCAYKPSGLGFLYKVFLLVGSQKILTIAQVYIESFSDKISLKSYKANNLEEGLISINSQETAINKMAAMIKQKTQYSQVTVKGASGKDFLYGNLYKMSIGTSAGNKAIFIYHDHSSEQVNILFSRANEQQDLCEYSGTECKSCKNANYRVWNNKCVPNVQHCQSYMEDLCGKCSSVSQLFDKVCILKSECGVLCQVVSM